MLDFVHKKENCDEAVDPQRPAAPRSVEMVSVRNEPKPKPQPKPRRYAISLFWNLGFKVTRPKRRSVPRGTAIQVDDRANERKPDLRG